MALLNPPDIVPEAMRYLIRALLAVPGKAAPEAELKDLVAPPGLAEAMTAVRAEDDEEPTSEDEREVKATGTTIAEASLAALRTLDLVTGGRERMVLGTDAPSHWKRAQDITAGEFSTGLLASLRSHYRPADSADSGGADDLVHGLTMLYAAADPLNPFISFDSGRGRRFIDWQRDKLGDDADRWPLYNRERWLPLRRWAVYLGVGRLVGSALMPDASFAIERNLRLEVREYSVEEFVQRCLTILPFLDTGGSLFGHDAEAEADHAILSPGLSLTLTILEAKGRIGLLKRSDVGGRTLRIGPDRTPDQRVTHVRWDGVQADAGRIS
jgi:hypothetical protein